MPRTYKTLSGVYSEEELVVAVWTNPRKGSKNPQARALETLTSEKSSYPIAFPLDTLQKIPSWMFCPVAKTGEDIDKWLTPEGATRQNPLLVPVILAKSHLGWDSFYIPTEYTDK
jgi:hypothetical protein